MPFRCEEVPAVRILLLSNLYPPEVGGGAEILAGEIAGELERLGHEVLVLTSAGGKRESAHTGPIWRTLRLAPPAAFDRTRPLWRQLDQPYHYYRRYHCRANARELARTVTVARPDILYIWEITGLGVSSLLRSLPALDVPIVFHLGSYWLLYARSPETAHSRLRAQWLKRWLIGRVPALAWTSLIAVSATVKREYVDAGFDPERIEVIHNGVSSCFFSASCAPDPLRALPQSKTIQLLFAGRLCLEKGVITILEALDLLINAPGPAAMARDLLHLHILGSGDPVYEAELNAYLLHKRLTDVVTFHGRVPQHQLITYYDHADIMLVPSLWKEPFGLVTVEAMARGLAVIASRVGGSAEIITDGENGLLVNPGDPHALATAIQDLARDASKRKRLAHSAQAAARERFTIAEDARRIGEHLRRAIRADARVGASV